MRPDDFFKSSDSSLDPFSRERLDTTLIREIRAAPLVDKDDSEVATALAQLVHDELQAFGTDGGEALSDAEMRDAIRALHSITNRLGIEGFEIPFRDFTTFKAYWLRNDGYRSWQARRDMLSEIFDDLHEQLEQLEFTSLQSTLADPVSPRGKTGWRAVDQEISELRRHFQRARTPQDYRNVGNDCVAVIEAVSREAYTAETNLREGEEEPPVAKTKQRLSRVVDDSLPGAEGAATRKLLTGAIETAQSVKHRRTPDRREAGMAADSVILLANLFRRLAD